MTKPTKFKKMSKEAAKTLPVFPKKSPIGKNIEAPDAPKYYEVVNKYYEPGPISESGDCKLVALFTYPDPIASAQAIVESYRSRCGLSAKPNAATVDELTSMIAAAITCAVDAATGKSEAYRNAREQALAHESKDATTPNY